MVSIQCSSSELCRLGAGCGIDAHHLPHIFDRFYRADDSLNRATGSTGLGLAIAHSIAGAHSGAIAVESTRQRLVVRDEASVQNNQGGLNHFVTTPADRSCTLQIPQLPLLEWICP